MRLRAAQILLAHLLVRDRLDHVGAGDEHVARLLGHHDEVGDGGRVDRAASAGAEDGRELRHHARGGDVAVEDVGVAGQRDHALLDARAARVVEADDGAAGAHRQVHHLADLLRVGAGEAAAEDGEVLREDEDLPALDRAIPGDHAVAEERPVLHAEVVVAVGLELVHLHERAGVEEQLDALARGELSLLVLLLHPLGAAAQLGLRVERGEAVARVEARETLLARGGRQAGGGLGRQGLSRVDRVGHGARNLLRAGRRGKGTATCRAGASAARARWRPAFPAPAGPPV